MNSHLRQDASRQALIAAALDMCARGLNEGTAGNMSCRRKSGDGREGFLITPTGMDYAALAPDDIVWVGLDGEAEGRRRPSSEWRLHRDIYAAFPRAGAVLHAHSPFAVALACLRRDIPPFHYMIARFGGDTVRCAPYALFGSQALSDAALGALRERNACLLANHGMVVHGGDLAEALRLGSELESLCAQYSRAITMGTPVLLGEEEMARVRERFRDYGGQGSGIGNQETATLAQSGT